MGNRAWTVAIAALLFCGAGIGQHQAMAGESAPAATPASPAATGLRVMSFNLRVPMVLDLYNFWPVRRELTARTIRDFRPDVLGTQECLASQASFLRQQLPEYNFVGAGRNDGKLGGEMCAIFYRADKFAELDHGHFWLSDTPEQPGSKSWGTWFTRMATWVKLKDRADGRVVYFFNTHLDSNGSRARLEGARLLKTRIATIACDNPAVLTGDFNTGEGSDPYQMLVGAASGAAIKLLDTYRQAHAAHALGEGSFHAFHGGTNGDRIDWIITSANVTTLAAGIVHTHSGLQFPSDHYPVTALLQLTAPITLPPATATPTAIASAHTAAIPPIPPLAAPPAITATPSNSLATP